MSVIISPPILQSRLTPSNRVQSTWPLGLRAAGIGPMLQEGFHNMSAGAGRPPKNWLGDACARERVVRPPFSHGDESAAKACVLSNIERQVKAGCAEWGVLRNGDIEVRLSSGEVFHVGAAIIIRIA